jgi:hypothetical protein
MEFVRVGARFHVVNSLRPDSTVCSVPISVPEPVFATFDSMAANERACPPCLANVHRTPRLAQAIRV